MVKKFNLIKICKKNRMQIKINNKDKDNTVLKGKEIKK